MGRGMAYYNAKDYNKAIIEFKQVIAADSSNVIAYNNIVASFNLLGMYKDAIEVGLKGLKQKPDYTLIKNNMKIAADGVKTFTPSEKYYLGASYNYFTQGEYKKCIIAAYEILKYNPKSAAAYNNICASNNALGNFKEGEAACEKGLQLVPKDQLLTNNKAVSERGLKGQ